jgi:hypothetical protein
MKTKELQQLQDLQQQQQPTSAGGGGKQKSPSSRLLINRTNVHFEGALVACAKLGLWREALGIYKDVMAKQGQANSNLDSKAILLGKGKQATTTSMIGSKGNGNGKSNDKGNGKDTLTNISTNISNIQPSTRTSSSSSRRTSTTSPSSISVTDNMILSIVSACIRGMKNRTTEHSQLRNQPFTPPQQREPLDVARSILISLQSTHDIPLVARHVNPLAAAYQYLNLHDDATQLLSYLPDRQTPAPDMETHFQPTFTVQDVNAKDVASYHILIQGAIVQGDWETAIENLKDMTDAKLYPTTRNLNVWSETAAKRERRGGRGKPSWRKERERVLVQGTLQGQANANANTASVGAAVGVGSSGKMYNVEEEKNKEEE